MKRKLLTASAIASILVSGVVSAQNYEPEAVSKVLEGYSNAESRYYMENFNVGMLTRGAAGGLWYNMHASQKVPTAVLLRRQPVITLEEKKVPAIGEIVVETDLGEMSLDNYLVHEKSYAQGMVIVHQGNVVYEEYPGMQPLDSHFWASNAKILASMAIDLLIDDGLIDENKTMGFYVPEFRGTAWEEIKVVDVMDMTAGLNAFDDAANFFNPESVTARMFSAMLAGSKDETLLDIINDAEKLEEPGEGFRYSSAATISLVYLAEAVTEKPWPAFFDQQVYSKMHVEGPLQVHLSQEGTALLSGPASSNLRDMARIGMLYTPSWDLVSTEQIISDEALERYQTVTRSPEWFQTDSAYRFINRLDSAEGVVGAGRQFDLLWDDGDFFKSGMNSQGLYISPDRDLVIAYFATEGTQRIQQYLRPIVTSGLFDKE
ncbi:serine hydrolase domain-containing protein [Thaumasiovibrio sp. DFM-14]|uniref:serine hydrolase domain-containing protein n=1 Tax=Thaumasiovibrio sp. DFM-14 TaxID=3384792 RepID=UPI0039A29202